MQITDSIAITTPPPPTTTTTIIVIAITTAIAQFQVITTTNKIK